MASIYGDLDTGNECLKRVNSSVSEDWAGGTKRMRAEDIERARKYLRETAKNMKAIREVLTNFEKII